MRAGRERGDGFGQRARIGYIVPSSGTVTENEWRAVAPDDVIFIGSRVLLDEVTADGVHGMRAQLERAAREVASADIDCLIQIGTPVGAFEGPRGDRDLGRWLSQVAGVPATTMSTACVEALAELGSRHIVLVTPYEPGVHARVTEFLTECGVTVVADRHLGLRSNLAINRLHPSTALDAVRAAVETTAEFDGVLVSCGGWRTFEVLDPLERELGVPVVSSNSAGLWMALALAEVDDPVPGAGRLLAGRRRSRAPADNGDAAEFSTANRRK
jgi:maleate isomerase